MKNIIALAALSTTILVAGCQTTDPYSRETKTSNTAKGAAIGALGGAVLGALTNTSSGEQAAKNAMIGAGIGAIAGGASGRYMDQQEKKLRERLDETGVGVTRVGDTIQLVMPGDITFATGRAEINNQFDYVLQDVGLVLQEFDKTVVFIDGHTDTVGSYQKNDELSQARANNVAARLMQEGILGGRLVVTGYGESRLKVPTGDGVNEPLNRRVEIRLEPYTN
ncbi:OmpA family protein [Hirschia baltica]|uniref:OmpA/MotB domain protein n=1 Tax=Hirschia baltica (strain ATCC 49814 / DSM 5838 / IFAM 1418) TaxID=582402 RepID=C6XN11_HIRBI|nr:OmpA family protein [Hirschia baltica]ACT58181.1 OmpA/MotB domain protein [Hirschia baltica ATCC 49814]